MAKQTINIGSAGNDGTGDTLRAGGDKINDNFDELYAVTDALGTAAGLDVDTDTTLAADSDSVVPSQKAVKAYVDENGGGGGATELSDLTDVADLSGASTGDVLTKDAGGDWVAAAPTGGGGGGGTFSGARISNSGALTPTTGSETDLTTGMNTEKFDTDNYFDAGTPGRLTVPATGYYMVFAQTRRSANVADQFICNIRQYDSSGTPIESFYGNDVESTGGDSAQAVTGPVAATAGDYFVLRYFVTNAGNFDAGTCWLSIVRVG